MKKIAIMFMMLIYSLCSFAGQDNIKLVIPWPAGGVWDPLARTIQTKLEAELKQNVVIEHRPGASGQIGSMHVINSNPNEVVLMLQGLSTVLNLLKNPAPYQSDQLVPLVYLGQSPFLFVTSIKSNIRTFDDYKNIPMDRNLSIGSTGGNSATDMMNASLNKSVRKNITLVPYKGGAPILVDLLSGVLDSSFLFVNIAGENVKAGKLNALAVHSSRRLEEFPNVPTFQELGVNDLGNFSWVVLFSNQTTNTKLQSQIQSVMFKILRDPKQLAEFRKTGLDLNVKDIVPRKDFLEHEKLKMTDLFKNFTIPN